MSKMEMSLTQIPRKLTVIHINIKNFFINICTIYIRNIYMENGIE